MKKFKKILIVDDSDLLRELSIDLLQQHEAAEEILQARNGLEAIEILDKDISNGLIIPDLILLDLQMPVMDGLEFLEQLRRSNQMKYLLRRVVVVTSCLTPSIETRIKASGVLWYYNKPFNEQILHSVLAEAN